MENTTQRPMWFQSKRIWVTIIIILGSLSVLIGVLATIDTVDSSLHDPSQRMPGHAYYLKTGDRESDQEKMYLVFNIDGQSLLMVKGHRLQSIALAGDEDVFKQAVSNPKRLTYKFNESGTTLTAKIRMGKGKLTFFKLKNIKFKGDTATATMSNDLIDHIYERPVNNDKVELVELKHP
ncbi:hypothetical protein [Limosilactobacillus equigenerosi]|uniref:Uncharacterized protein n=1 Tax=Limosilactobacillus equigenerosi DSM 18793 = JCM 14505 TaxID=1423742 RepID=A0A0R1UL34_9LACO|nr:hypothetical protein [Limosilactobacillus equigenerosi]KRL93980.1 hypothetical protein FC21_GL001452 [Limosilactobacillus equigenerosi DSM 18793 = JCM 14505]